jgi:ABC-type glutathione transport system ATPase component
VKDIRRYLDRETSDEPACSTHGASKMSAAQSSPLLSVENVSKTYWRGPHELRVLRDVSLDGASLSRDRHAAAGMKR